MATQFYTLEDLQGRVNRLIEAQGKDLLHGGYTLAKMFAPSMITEMRCLVIKKPLQMSLLS